MSTDNILDREYSEKAARRALARAAQQRRIESQRQYLDAEPIWERDELAAEVRRLAASWGLKRKKEKRP